LAAVAGVALKREGRVAWLVVDRPEARNALNNAAMDDLERLLSEAAGWDDCHLLFLRGAGDRAFIAGGDLKELESVRDETFALHLATRMRRTLDRIPGLPMPVVAAINGHAIGGGAEVAVACDFRVMVEGARIGFTQSRLGLMPAWGGIERLTQLAGRGRALLMLTTGAELTAREAFELGLVEEVVARDRFEARLRELADLLADTPRAALAGIKAAAGAAAPYARPELEGPAAADFARAWVDPEHWAALERATERRRRARA
jgi:enoyl-CoA hydratase/carnithine racemase